jgi:hypothetical protein
MWAKKHREHVRGRTAYARLLPVTSHGGTTNSRCNPSSVKCQRKTGHWANWGWLLANKLGGHFALNLQWQTAFRATRIKWWTMDQRRHLVPALAVRDHNEQMHRIAWKPQFTTNPSPPLRSIAAQYARKLIGANTSQSVESFKLARLLVEPLCFSKPSSTGFDYLPRHYGSSPSTDFSSMDWTLNDS